MQKDAPGAWQLVCKIWGHWPKALGHSKTKCLKILKNAKFWTPNFMLSSNLDFQSHWTFEKICISMNLLMENRFSKPVSMCTLSLSTRPDTRPIPVTDRWAGAEMRVFTLSNSITTDQPTNQPTNGRTDGRTKPLIESLVRD